MRKKSFAKLLFLIIPFATVIIDSCTKDKGTDTESPSGLTDSELFSQNSASGYTFFKNNSDTLAFTPNGGGHGGFIRVKFNSIAQAALDSTGHLPAGANFPNGSVVVKEIYQSKGGILQKVAVMYKSSSDPNHGANWVWGEYNADGSNVAPVSLKGSACVSCHSRTSSNSEVPGDRGNSDLVRTFGLR
jgi:hypothetical protein